ncbi:MAG: zinc ABC transporter substrate-binding protein [Bacteroidota bacterium]
MKNLGLLLLFCCISIFAEAQEKPRVAVTASMIWDMTKIIAGDHAQVDCIVPIGSDPHTFEPTPDDAREVAKANLIIKNGLTFEGWLDELINNSGTKAEVVTVTDDIPAITSLTYHDAADPHAWMDVSFAQIYIKNIKDALVKLLPEHSADFEKNYQKYKEELMELDRYIMQAIQSIPKSRRILITSHDAFQYYGRRYGIRLEAIMGVSTDAEAQTSDILRLNKIIRESKIPAVFVESTINPKLLERLAKDHKIKVGGELFADSIGGKNSKAPTYVAMMRHNTDVIVNALKEEVEGADNKAQEEEKSNSNWFFIGLIAALFIGGFILVAKKMNGPS